MKTRRSVPRTPTRSVLRKAALALLPLLLIGTGTTVGAPRLGGQLVDGSVVRTKGCGIYFFIAYGNTFALAEWLSGDPVRDTEILQTTDGTSSFDHEGRMTVTNLATGRTLDLFIDKALMNNAEFSRSAAKYCH